MRRFFCTALMMLSACLFSSAAYSVNVLRTAETGKADGLVIESHIDPGTDECVANVPVCIILIYVAPAADSAHSLDGKDHAHCYPVVRYAKTHAGAHVKWVVWALVDALADHNVYRFADNRPIDLQDSSDFLPIGHIGTDRRFFVWSLKHQVPRNETGYNIIVKRTGGGTSEDCEPTDPVIAND